MRIEVVGDDSISHQARIYAEYRLFAALSQGLDTRRVRSASLDLRRGSSKRYGELVSCRVTIESDSGDVARLRVSAEHPYAAINRVVERLRAAPWPGRDDASGPWRASGKREHPQPRDEGVSGDGLDSPGGAR